MVATVEVPVSPEKAGSEQDVAVVTVIAFLEGRISETPLGMERLKLGRLRLALADMRLRADDAALTTVSPISSACDELTVVSELPPVVSEPPAEESAAVDPPQPESARRNEIKNALLQPFIPRQIPDLERYRNIFYSES